jgi:hypothetical protein
VALGCTTVPATQPIPGESGLLEDFDVLGDISQGCAVTTSGTPICITIAKVMVSLGDCYRCIFHLVFVFLHC